MKHIDFIKLKRWRVYLINHIVKWNIIYIYNWSKYLNVALKASIISDYLASERDMIKVS